MNLRTECVTKVQRREYRSKYFHRKFSILENFSAFHILKINQNSKFSTYISIYYKNTPFPQNSSASSFIWAFAIPATHKTWPYLHGIHHVGAIVPPCCSNWNRSSEENVFAKTKMPFFPPPFICNKNNNAPLTRICTTLFLTDPSK